MNHTPAYILAALLTKVGVEIFTPPSEAEAWPLYISHEPDGPRVEDNCGTVYDTEGVKDGRVMSGENIFHHGVQLRIRTGQYTDGWVKAEEAAVYLETVQEEEVDIGEETYQIDAVTQTSPILPLGQEEGTSKRRELFTVNFLVSLKQLV